MRIPSGVVDQVIFFVAVDSSDLKTRETGLSSFTVYRSRNGGAATAMTTPTVAELSTANMPGVYSLLLDEDMTIDAGDDSQEMVFHITQASMAPVTRVIEVYRSKITAGYTLGVESDGDLTKVNTLDGHTPQTGDSFIRLGAPAGASIAADLLAIDNFVDDLEGRLTAGRAGYLDNLSAGAVALASVCTDARLAELAAANLPADIDTLLARLTAIRAGYLDNLNGHIPQTGDNYTRLGAPAGASVSADIAAVKAETVAIKAKTDNLPADPADDSDIDAQLAAINGLVDDLESRLTAARAGYLDNLNGHTPQTGDNYTRLGAPTGASIAADIAAVKAKADLLPEGPAKNQAYNNIEFLMVDSADHVTPKTGLVVTGERSIDGAAFAAVTGAIAEVSDGIYQFDALAADMNGDEITFLFTAAGADNCYLTIRTTS